MDFLTDDFLLSTDTARQLYHDHARSQPIYDYHCHLPPADLAANRQFDNLFDIWLAGDHYKWRAMRANGIDEQYCTGDAEPYDKFLAFARTVPQTMRNPLYHWTHLELRRYFGITELLNEKSAPAIWEQANAQLPSLRPADIMQKMNVALIGTTDDPADDLAHHRTLTENPTTLADTAVYPAFRPDKAYALTDVIAWNDYTDRLAGVAETSIKNLDDFLAVLTSRHDYFHEMGSRLSDHGLTHIPAAPCSEKHAKKIFKAARAGKTISLKNRDRFTFFMMLFFGRLDAAKGWTKQLHLGAMRNNNAWAWENLGPDTGFDSIGDYPQGAGLSSYLGTLAGEQKLPKTILYNLNPRDNYLFATMVGNFNGAGDPANTPGKMQFGSGWWFLDQLEGMTWQINALSNLGLLSRFVGMLTDSRSFLSYPRHEYFRRLLCELIGRDVADGQLPADLDHLGEMVKNIAFTNAKNYFGMTLKGKHHG